MDNQRRIVSISIRDEVDVVACRQAAKRIAAWLELPALDQIRFATAVSELARNIYQYAGEGGVHFDLLLNDRDRVIGLGFLAEDQGPGIAELDRILSGDYVSRTGMGVGLRGAQRLLDEFDIRSSAEGTRIRASKAVYPPRPLPTTTALSKIRQELHDLGSADPYTELAVRGKELLLTSAELQSKQQALEATSQELENTNMGVVALYSELEKAAMEVREASEAKNRFFSNMTHEFRTPINIIENVAKLLASGVDGPLSPEQYKQVRFISDAAAELSGLVNSLLGLAEAESGRMEVVSERFSLGEFVEQVRQFTQALAIRYPAIDWSIAGIHDDVVLETDRGMLFQILRNLINNAFKYTPQGQISLRIFLTDATTLEFLVEDTGVGIATEDQERVFEEFLRVRTAGLTHVQGTGLGLPLAKRLARLLEGDIQLSSTPGKGSCFTLRLPCLYQGQPRDLAELDLSPLTLLVIDDQAADRYRLARLLEPYGPLVIEAENAASSIDKLHAVRPDIIFLDLDLPDISGEDLLDSMDWSMHARVLINTNRQLDDAAYQRLSTQCAAILYKTQPDYDEAMLRQVQRLAEVRIDAQ